MAELSHGEVAEIIGRTSDVIVAEIIGTGITKDELAAAYARTQNTEAGINAIDRAKLVAAYQQRLRPEQALLVITGPNAGGKSLYSLDPDGYIFEFHQRPPA